MTAALAFITGVLVIMSTKSQEKQSGKKLTGDEILRRMLNTPPQPHEAKPVPKPVAKKRAKKPA